MSIYGYCRVSAADQNENRQLDAMLGLGIPHRNLYVDKQSGKNFRRPAWNELSIKLRTGDLLYIHSLYESQVKHCEGETENRGL